MTVSKLKQFVLVDKKTKTSKNKFFILGQIIASGCLTGAFLIALYIEYLHNPGFHVFIQSKGIFL